MGKGRALGADPATTVTNIQIQNAVMGWFFVKFPPKNKVPWSGEQQRIILNQV